LIPPYATSLPEAWTICLNHCESSSAPRAKQGTRPKSYKSCCTSKIRGLVEQWRRGASKLAHAPTTQVPDDTEDALALLNELLEYRDDLLSNTNLVYRYQLNRIAIPKLCERMNAARTKAAGGPLQEVITLAAYTNFEKKSRWQWQAGYRRHTDLTSADGTEPISGVSEKERQELKEASGVDPRQVSPSPQEAVRGVSWYDAAVYCLFAGGRLPTKEELSELSPGKQVTDLWEWSQSWLFEKEAHMAVARSGTGGRTELIGVNPDLRLPKIGFRVIR
jgi:hypothetical protein